MGKEAVKVIIIYEAAHKELSDLLKKAKKLFKGANLVLSECTSYEITDVLSSDALIFASEQIDPLAWTQSAELFSGISLAGRKSATISTGDKKTLSFLHTLLKNAEIPTEHDFLYKNDDFEARLSAWFNTLL